MIRAFILDKFSDYDYFLIDPEKDNTKAIHVYEKAGFDYLGEFSPSYNPVPHVMMRLKVCDLKNGKSFSIDIHESSNFMYLFCDLQERKNRKSMSRQTIS